MDENQEKFDHGFVKSTSNDIYKKAIPANKKKSFFF